MAVATASALTVELIPLDRIHANRNLRETLPDIPQLAESIRRQGMLTAILVDRCPDGGYELVAGFRRHAAALIAGLDVVPAVVREAGEDRARIASQVAEDIDRIDLTGLEQAQGMQQMLNLGLSVEEVAATLGATAEAVDAWTAVLRLAQHGGRGTPHDHRGLQGGSRRGAQAAAALLLLPQQLLREAIRRRHLSFVLYWCPHSGG